MKHFTYFGKDESGSAEFLSKDGEYILMPEAVWAAFGEPTTVHAYPDRQQPGVWNIGL